jgi:hypothetical protein
LVVCLSLSGCVSAQDSEIGKILRRDVGTWDAEVKMFADLAAPPEVTKGVETNFLVGPYWLISHFKGKIMGADFEGSSQTGYDQASKKFVGTWVDSMSPHPMKMEGTWDEKTQTMTSTGTGKDPNGSEAKHKMVLVYNKDGSRNFTMFGYINGAEVKMMEIKYTRAASK